jgi:rRNA processing protein Gar1
LKFDAKVVFCVGDEVVAKVLPRSESGNSEVNNILSLEKARKLYGRRVSTQNQAVGKIADVIGNVESPFVVFKLTKKVQGGIVNKIVKFG